MADQVISCPKCSTRIPLSEAIAQHLAEAVQREMEGKIAEQQKLLAAKEKSLRDQEANLAAKLQADRERIEKEAVKRADERRALELRDLQSQIQEKEKKLEESRQAQLELMRQKREVEDARKELDLQLQRKLDEQKKGVEEQILARAAQEQHQKALEAAQREADLKKIIDDLKRRAEQGSQQTQGEVVELELEGLLRNSFPTDQIEPVAKGIRGADVVQRVIRNGKLCGTIIWESKQTKVFSEGWIDKLKQDQREAKADIAVLMTAALPKGVTTFAQQNGVFVTGLSCVASLASTLRWAIVQHALARSLAEGTEGKMKALYDYLSGPEFRQRVAAVADATNLLRDQLEREKRLYQKNWAEREKYITRVSDGLFGMQGDLRGLGAALEHNDAIDGEIEDARPAKPAAALPGPDRAAEEDDELF